MKRYESFVLNTTYIVNYFTKTPMKTSETGFIQYFPSSFHLIQKQEKDESIANDIHLYN